MLIILGLLFLLAWCLVKATKVGSDFILIHRILFYPSEKLSDYLFKAPFIGLFTHNWPHKIIHWSILWRLQIWDKRQFLFYSCQSVVGASVLGFLVGGIFSFNSLYILGGISVLFVLIRILIKKNKYRFAMESFLEWLFCYGLAWVALELTFKNFGLVLNYLQESELAFVLTIDSVWNYFLVLMASLLVGVVIPVFGIVSIIGFLLFVNSYLSVTNLIVLLSAEFLIVGILILFRSLTWDNFYQKRISGLWKSLFLSWPIFILVALGVRYLFSLEFSFNQIFYLKYIWLAFYLILLFQIWIVLMIWGHFSSKEIVKETVLTDSSCISFSDLESIQILNSVQDKIKDRLNKITEFLNECNQADSSAVKKVPPFILEKFEQEKATLQSIIKTIY